MRALPSRHEWLGSALLLSGLLFGAGAAWAGGPCDDILAAAKAHATEAGKDDSSASALAGQERALVASAAKCVSSTAALSADAEAAIERLKEGDGAGAEEASTKLAGWRTQAKALEAGWKAWESKFWTYQKESLAQRALDADGLNELRMLICDSDWGDADEQAAVSKMQSVASTLTAKVNAADGSLDRTADELHTESLAVLEKMRALDAEVSAYLKAQAEPLAKHAKVKAELSAFLAENKKFRAANVHEKYRPTGSPSKVNADKQTRENVKNCVLRGRSHPWVEAARTYGDNKHRELQGGCDLAEVEIGKGRADCIQFGDKTCEIVEIKPDSWSPGACRDQADGYKAGLSAVLRDARRGAGSSKLDRFAKACRDAEGNPKELSVRCQTYPACKEKPKSAQVCE